MMCLILDYIKFKRNYKIKALGGSQTEPANPLKRKSSSFEGILLDLICCILEFLGSKLNPGAVTVKTKASGVEWIINGSF